MDSIKTVLSMLLLSVGLMFSAASIAIEKGQTAPNFRLPLLDSQKKVSLKQYRGKVVYVDFWASWCGPCRQSLPLLTKLRAEMKKQPFEVLAINLDEEVDAAKGFLKQYPVNYPVLLDPEGNVAAQYQLPGMPTSFIVDKRGRIKHVHVGFKPQDIDKIRQQVKSLL
ncbi:TlpA disulfide reductase family protein [Bermanella marisrubri]|uniref:Thiol:disulfide interchange protein DsbE, putative n=1 Tax=Bermanella marisrubri TaxID=207949 RepID=Q1N0M7_9GAMM|nr:TlpA disulfide reductase family protein [Bermanella marisrubri]EAT11806.1 thiol:disulfide interchange protein DsbE, putative [Oceanobacter sp. RED65] [Bermanella marisrubri]